MNLLLDIYIKHIYARLKTEFHVSQTHCVAEDDLYLLVLLHGSPSAEVMDRHHHTRFIQCWGLSCSRNARPALSQLSYIPCRGVVVPYTSYLPT